MSGGKTRAILHILATLSAANALADYPALIAEDKPVAYWRFDDALDCCAQSAVGELKATLGSGVSLIVPGPRPPEFPAFAAENLAAELTVPGKDAVLRVKDPGPRSVLDFTNGDTITVEAWVQCRGPLRDGQSAPIVGKGRTGNPGFPRDNQNWALTLLGDGRLARASFTFHTAAGTAHRWTTRLAFTPGETWHHIAITYRFGQPGSIRAWLDGKPSAGTWKKNRTTNRPPVVDDDEVWIGATLRADAAHTFPGCMDEVALYRTALPTARIQLHAARAAKVISPRQGA